jgi:septation ring formation regulator EzrA
VWLEAALSVAHALSVKAASHDKQDAASFEKIDKAIERIRKHIEGFDEINTTANTVKTSAEKILTRARIMQEGLSTQIQAVIDEVLKLKDDATRG